MSPSQRERWRDAELFAAASFAAFHSIPNNPRMMGEITMAEDHSWWAVLRPRG